MNALIFHLNNSTNVFCDEIMGDFDQKSSIARMAVIRTKRKWATEYNMGREKLIYKNHENKNGPTLQLQTLWRYIMLWLRGIRHSFCGPTWAVHATSLSHISFLLWSILLPLTMFGPTNKLSFDCIFLCFIQSDDDLFGFFFFPKLFHSPDYLLSWLIKDWRQSGGQLPLIVSLDKHKFHHETQFR